MRHLSTFGRLILPLFLLCGFCSAQTPPGNAPAAKPPGQLAREALFPLDPIAAQVSQKKVDWEPEWHKDASNQLSPLAEAAYHASQTIDRALVVDHFQSPAFVAAHPNARLNLDIGRHEYLKWACAEALKRTNAHMKETGQKPLESIVIYNSSIVKDFSRDADLTVYTDDEMSEKVFFDYLNKVFLEKRGNYASGLATTLRGKEKEYGRSISLDSMEVTFHRGTNEPPSVHAPLELMEFNLSYRRGVERQAENPEAYIGFGFEQEVQARRTMQLEVKQPALLAQTFTADAANNVKCKGQYVTNPTEALNILQTTFGPEFSAAHNAMHVFCDFFQASHHMQNPAEQIDKGPLKYSVRATDAICRLFGYDKKEVYVKRIDAIKANDAAATPSVWSVLTEDERVALLKRVIWRGEDPPDLYEKRARRIAQVLAIDPKSRKGTIGQDADSQMSLIILRRLAAEALRTVAQQMMCPDAVRPDGYPADKWNSMNPQERMLRNLMDAKIKSAQLKKTMPAYEDKLSVAAMENMLIALRLLHQIDLDTEHAQDASKQNITHWGANAVDQIICESSPEMQRVLKLASEHGKLAALMTWPKPPGMKDDVWAKVRRGWVQRLDALRFEISGECYAFRDHKERARINGFGSMPPDDFCGRFNRPDGGLDGELAEAKSIQKRHFQMSLGGDEPPKPPPGVLKRGALKLGQLGVDMVSDPSNMPDVLNFIEMYQGGAGNKDYAKFFLSTALSRYNSVLGYAWQATDISAIQDLDAQNHALKEMGKGVVFQGLAYFIPGAGEAKLFFDIERGVVMVTFGYAVNTLNNGVIDAMYSGDAGRDPDLVGSISLKGHVRDGIEPVVPAQFFYVPQGQKKAVVNVVDFYKFLWKNYTGLNAEESYRPPIGQKKIAALVRAHDDYLKLFSERADYLEPTWFNSARSVAEHVYSPSLLFNPSTLEEKMKVLLDALEPFAQEQVDKVLDSEVGASLQPYIQEVNGKKVDVVREGMKNRLKMDFVAGAQSFWQSRMLMQLQARQMLENLGVAADVNGLAQELAKGDRLLSKGQPLPAFAIRIIGPDPGEDSLKWEFDGAQPLPLSIALKPLGVIPDDTPQVIKELDFGPIQKVPATYRPYKNLAAGVFDYAAAQNDPTLWADQVYSQQLIARAKNKATGAVLVECRGTIFVRLPPVGLAIEKDVYTAMTRESVAIRAIPKAMPPPTHKLPRFEADFGDGQKGESLLVTTLEHTYNQAGEFPVHVKYFATDMDGKRPPILLGEAACKVLVRPRRLIVVDRQKITGKDLGAGSSFSQWIGWSQTVNLHYTYEEGFPDSPEGKFLISYPDGTAKVDGSFNSGRLDGPFTQYYNNGKPLQQSTFKNGNMVGRTTTWYFNGKVNTESEDDAAGNPKWTKTYWDSGGLQKEWVYSGLRTGHYREFFGNGKVAVEYDVKDGTVVPGSTKCYDSNGNLTGKN